ncbi:hypothetical protein Trydic_g8173 [Trypoxylus dichotomus]
MHCCRLFVSIFGDHVSLNLSETSLSAARNDTRTLISFHLIAHSEYIRSDKFLLPVNSRASSQHTASPSVEKSLNSCGELGNRTRSHQLRCINSPHVNHSEEE